MSLNEITIEEVSLGLQKNAHEFIEKGLSYIIADETTDYKYSILHIFSGTLIFFKDVLFKEHWSFIFQDIDKAAKDDLINDKIKSVDFTTLMSRINNLTDKKLEDKLVGDLEWMQKQRNKIEHFRYDLNYQEVKSRLASMLGNLIIYIKELHRADDSYDKTGFSEHDYEDLFQMLQGYSLKFQEYINKRNVRIQSDIKNCDCIIKCPSCNQKALEIKVAEGETLCHFCLEELTHDIFLGKYTTIKYDVETHDIVENGQCPSCHSWLLYEGEEIIFLECLDTFEKGSLTGCLRCGITISGEGICDSCMDFVMNQ